MKEKQVRDWVRRVWSGRPLTWVEPRRGSTVGAADLYLPLGKLLLPVELKVFEETTRGYVVDKAVRPAQVVYHYQLNNGGVLSGFLFGLKGNSPRVFFADGAYVVSVMMKEDPNERYLQKDFCTLLSQDAVLNEAWLSAQLLSR